MTSTSAFMVSVMLLVIGDAFSGESRSPVLHRVGGGRTTWNPSHNFSDWSLHEQFFVGDWLYFGFDKQRYNVLEVNRTSYETCDEANYVSNVTRGGRDVFNLTEAKPYYFICGRGFCFQGMKLEVQVREIPSAPPSGDDLRVSDTLSYHNLGLFGPVISTLACLVLLL